MIESVGEDITQLQGCVTARVFCLQPLGAHTGFLEKSRMRQLDPIASLRHTRIAVSSLFLRPPCAYSATLASWVLTASSWIVVMVSHTQFSLEVTALRSVDMLLPG